MTNLLKNITTLHSGYTIRQKIENDPEGESRLIQFRDVSPKGINPESPIKIKGGKLPQKHFLGYGDVLFLAKGNPNFAIPYGKEFSSAIASSSFTILRIENEEILPEYLAWYINQPKAQHFIKERSGGNYITSITKKELGELPISILPKEKQRKIVHISNLQQKAENLYEKLKEKERKLVQKQLMDYVEKV